VKGSAPLKSTVITFRCYLWNGNVINNVDGGSNSKTCAA
jgi:hypothetical protein